MGCEKKREERGCEEGKEYVGSEERREDVGCEQRTVERREVRGEIGDRYCNEEHMKM